MTKQQHVEQNRARIEREAREYAASYACDYDTALREVTDEYVQGWHDERDEAQYSGVQA